MSTRYPGFDGLEFTAGELAQARLIGESSSMSELKLFRDMKRIGITSVTLKRKDARKLVRAIIEQRAAFNGTPVSVLVDEYIRIGYAEVYGIQVRWTNA